MYNGLYISSNITSVFHKHAHTQSPLMKICPTKVKFKWAKWEYSSFIVMKKIFGIYVLLSYPIFSEKFIINTGARQMHLQGLFSLKLSLIAYDSWKLTPKKI